ncbi:class I SAM-dependent RNA methyltransferase [Pararhodospirillum photometricum]|nr:class I SAM-dependent RNA methyltransferase [Pararhodospirillum photometricum]
MSRPPAAITAHVASLGDRGDGVTEPVAGRHYYVPGALPGEEIRLIPGPRRGDGWAATLESVLSPSPNRVAPPCPHAAQCGGCDLLHLDPAAQATWKRAKVERALAHRGLDDVMVRPLLSVGLGTRRRLAVGLRGRKAGGVAGFHERASSRLIDTPSCCLPTPALHQALAVLRHHAGDFLEPGEEVQALLTETETGVDVVIDAPRGPDLAVREALVALAQTADFARVALRRKSTVDPVAERRAPTLTLGGQELRLPPGPFLQPSREGEGHLVALVLEALAGLAPGSRVVDLFCGVGTFSVPLAATGLQVEAYDEAATAVAPLSRASTRIRAQARDLFRNPLAGGEWQGVTAAVLDPPRAGAQGQTQALAEAGPAHLALVSCAPGTFARDLRVLVEAGYEVAWVQPVDQFTGSHHVEVVAKVTRG